MFGFLAGMGFPLYGIMGFINNRIIMLGRGFGNEITGPECYLISSFYFIIGIVALVWTVRQLILDLKRYSSATTGTIAKSSILEISPNGATILSELIRMGVVNDFYYARISLKPNLDQKEDMLREILKGDFDKVWIILQNSNK
jgi:hypothetical protein